MVIFGIFVWLWIASAIFAAAALYCARIFARNHAKLNDILILIQPVLANRVSGFVQLLWLRDINSSRASPDVLHETRIESHPATPKRQQADNSIDLTYCNFDFGQ